jgi:isopenicillin N synthase-like dioxygenase
MTFDSIPLIDLAPWTWKDTDPSRSSNKYSQEDRLQVVQQVQQACREIGFFAVQNHGVDESVMDIAWAASTYFFDLPMDMKLESKTEDEKVYPYGYVQSERLTLGKELVASISNNSSSSDKVAVPIEATPVAIATTSTALAPADLKESFSIGPCNPDSGEPPRRFPAQPITFQPALEKYYAAMEDLAALLLRIFALALDLPPDWFQDKTDHHMSALRVLNYFAVDRVGENDDDDDGNQSSISDVSQLVRPLRAGAHTDYGALTILKSGGPGLQVKKTWAVAAVTANMKIRMNG